MDSQTAILNSQSSSNIPRNAKDLQDIIDEAQESSKYQNINSRLHTIENTATYCIGSIIILCILFELFDKFSIFVKIASL